MELTVHFLCCHWEKKSRRLVQTHRDSRFPPAWPALISNRHGRLNFSSSFSSAFISPSTEAAAAASFCNICIHAHIIIYTVAAQYRRWDSDTTVVVAAAAAAATCRGGNAHTAAAKRSILFFHSFQLPFLKSCFLFNSDQIQTSHKINRKEGNLKRHFRK